MYTFYTTCLFIYFVLMGPYYFFHMLFKEHYRAGLWQRLGFVPAVDIGSDALRILMHGVSVGEIQVLAELGRRLLAQGPAAPRIHLMFCTTTLAAQRLAQQRIAQSGLEADLFYFPLDIPFALRRTLDRVKPSFVILAETELWPHFLRECHARAIPVALVNGRISERSFARYRWIGEFMKIFLPYIDLFLMQDDLVAERIVALGAPPDRVQVTGNMKADFQALPPKGKDALERIFNGLRHAKDAKILLAGSTHPGEEAVLGRLFGAWRQAVPGLVMVLAPRHLPRVDGVVRELEALGLCCVRRSQVDGSTDLSKVHVLLLDTLGELAWTYRYVDLVFIGKSLCAHGGQNPMEAACLGKPLIFGPHMENFPKETAALLRAGGALQVANEQQLEHVAKGLLQDTGRMQEIGDKARLAMAGLQGALDRNVRILSAFLTKRT